MFGATLALFIRSLRVDARFLRMHLFRLLLVSLIYFKLLSIQSIGSWLGAPGLSFFSSISFVNFFFISLAGVSFFSSAITEEKEEMTLGLLKIAGIQPLALLLGKSTPRLIAAALLLSVQFPFTLLAITLGGVTMQQVLAVYVALSAYLLLVANLGLFFSVVCSRSRSAAGLTGIMLVLFFCGPSLLEASISALEFYQWVPSDGFISQAGYALSGKFAEASVFTRLTMIMMTGFSQSVMSFQVYSNLGAALLFFGLSWVSFNRFNRSEQPVLPSQGTRLQLPWKPRRSTSGRAWKWALVWKDFHHIAGGYRMMVIKFVLYGLIIPLDMYIRYAQSSIYVFNFYDTATTLTSCMLFALIIESSLYASRLFSDEIKSNTLSSISLLPLSTPQLAYSKLAGCFLGLLPALTFFFLGLLVVFPEFQLSMNHTENILGAGAIFLYFIFFLHLVSFLSLLVKWGALPLAFALTFVFPMFFTPFMFLFLGRGLEPEAGLVAFNLFFILGIVLLQAVIGSRLKLLAGR